MEKAFQEKQFIKNKGGKKILIASVQRIKEASGHILTGIQTE